MSDQNNSRRKFIKAAVYAAPVVLTLKAAPSFACGGSPCGKKLTKNERREARIARREARIARREARIARREARREED